MRRSVSTLASIGIAALVAAAGCRDTGTNYTPVKDMTTNPPRDMSGSNVDMAMQIGGDGGLQPTKVTIHDLYGGMVKDGDLVVVENAVVTGSARILGASKTNMICQYEAWVQSANQPAPSGVRLYFKGQKCSTPDGGTSCLCPAPPDTGTLVDKLTGNSSFGDVYTITGYLGVYTPMSAPSQHELDVVLMTKTGSGATITPAAITDLAPFAKNGMGLQQYENTLVVLKPAMPGTITNLNQYAEFDWAGAHVIGSYRFLYPKTDAGNFLQNGQTWSEITGIAVLPYGGGVMPRGPEDFKP